MRDHIKILGVLNIVMGSLAGLIGLGVLFVMGAVAGVISSAINNSDVNAAAAAPIVALIGVCIAVFFLILAAPSIIGGWGLIKFKPWARILTLIVSAFHLFHVPLGTALGIYGFWVLLSDESRRLLETGGAYVPSAQYPPATNYPQQPTYPPPQPPPTGGL